MKIRIGHGFDVHRFGGEGPCTLGGVKVPYSQGLIAHSDGDVVLHALCDALLGALALGDIGELYPDNDDAYLDVDSRKLLRETYRRVKEQGFVVGNVDITVMAQEPKLKPYKALMRAFGDIESVRSADEESLAAAPGMNRGAARAVYQFFHSKKE